MRDGSLGEADGVPDVELVGGRKILRRGLQQVAADGAASICHSTVESTEPFGRFADSLRECLHVGDIHCNVDDTRAVPFQIGTSAIQLIGSAREDCHVGPFAGQRVRDGFADTAAAAGDHKPPAV